MFESRPARREGRGDVRGLARLRVRKGRASITRRAAQHRLCRHCRRRASSGSCSVPGRCVGGSSRRGHARSAPSASTTSRPPPWRLRSRCRCTWLHALVDIDWDSSRLARRLLRVGPPLLGSAERCASVARDGLRSPRSCSSPAGGLYSLSAPLARGEQGRRLHHGAASAATARPPRTRASAIDLNPSRRCRSGRSRLPTRRSATCVMRRRSTSARATGSSRENPDTWVSLGSTSSCFGDVFLAYQGAERRYTLDPYGRPVSRAGRSTEARAAGREARNA